MTARAETLSLPTLAELAASSRKKSDMDERAFHVFYDRTARPLWAYLTRASGNPQLADDLVQESFYRYVRSDFRPESFAHGKNFLYKIGTNLLRDHFRRAKRSEVGLFDSTAKEGKKPDFDLRRDMKQLMGELKHRDRKLLWLAHVEGSAIVRLQRLSASRKPAYDSCFFAHEEGWPIS